MAEQRVQANKVVSVKYSIVDDRGEVVEQIDVPVDYVHGGPSGLFEKIEQALEGKTVGEAVEVTLSPEEGFGVWDPELTYTDAIENVPPEYRKVGEKAEFYNDKGETIAMTVTHVDNGTVTLDGNHPFAGKTVTFNVTVAAVREASPDEMVNGIEPPTLH